MKTISDFELRIGMLVPAELRTYFTELNGMEEDYDQEMFSFYPFKRFKNLKEEFIDSENNNGLGIYAIAGNEVVLICNTFIQFLELYLNDLDRLYI